MNKALSLLIGVVFTVSQILAQSGQNGPATAAPIPVDILFGNNRFVTQFSLSKRFAPNSKFGFMATSYTAADYGNDKTQNESMNVALINYEILNGFSVVGGAALNSHWGFRPYSGLQYVYANKQFMAMLMPGFYLTESHNFESIGFVEYHPHIQNNWSLYSRIEGAYNLDMDTQKHERSHLYARLGLIYKTVGFGLGTNFDWYGPFSQSKDNTGLFIRKVF